MRMTDERLVEISRQLGFMGVRDTTHAADELLQELKAEREEVEYMDRDRIAIAKIRDKKSTQARRRITQLEAQAEAAKEYVKHIDGLPGSQNWRIKKDILEALEDT